jgi:hypothetical protein
MPSTYKWQISDALHGCSEHKRRCVLPTITKACRADSWVSSALLQGKYTAQAYRALRDTQEHINADIFNSTNGDDTSDAFLYSSDYIFCEWPADTNVNRNGTKIPCVRRIRVIVTYLCCGYF